MNHIHKLSQELIPKIAAGEVVESPSAAIKELIENSIDAGSTKILLDITNSGFDTIRVVDDGMGISSEDLDICFQPFYTSKIHEIEDLHSIKTLGFRGEALSSICAVSSVSIKSRTVNEAIGNSLEIREGSLQKKSQFGMNQGTIIEINGLFKNIPARRKFIKNTKLEYQKILEVFIAYAIAYPSIAFKLYKDGVLVTSTTTENLNSRIENLLGKDIFNTLVFVKSSDPYFNLEGYVGKPQAATIASVDQYFYINKRFVSDKNLAKVIKKAYDNLLPHDTYPPFLLFLTISSDLIDVNVHPKKQIVNFWDENYVYTALENIIRNTLKDNDLTYVIGENVNEYRYDKTAENSTFTRLKDSVPMWSAETNTFELYSETFQIANTYIATPVKEGILLVDQHAAHESILFEELQKQFIENRLQSAQFTLLNPISISFPLKETQTLIDNLDLFQDYGFEIFQSGKDTLEITKVPEILKERPIESLVKDMLSEITLTGKLLDMDYRTRRTIAFLSCRSAIKAGDILSPHERRNIFLKLDNCTDLYSCPHGRPVKIILKTSELARLFKRIK